MHNPLFYDSFAVTCINLSRMSLFVASPDYFILNQKDASKTPNDSLNRKMISCSHYWNIFETPYGPVNNPTQ